MSETPDGRPRPTPRPRPAARPSPRPRVAGTRREREAADAAETPRTGSAPAEPAVATTAATPTARPRAPRRPAAGSAVRDAGRATARRRSTGLLAVLAALCLAAAAAAGVLLYQRLNPTHVDSSVFAATRDGVKALYAYDYEDSEGSVQGKLDVLTGELRDQYEEDLGQGGIIDTYEQVSATTSYEVLDVALKQINDAQDTATLVVFGEYVVKSVNSGTQPAPDGSGCRVTSDGSQACIQTVRVQVVKADGDWKINELTLVTTS